MSFNIVIRQIYSACERARRDPQSVHLLAVSKGRSIEQIQALYEQGQRDFGENYADELKIKQEKLSEKYADIRWHFIGQIQSNKIKIISRADVVHTVSNIRHAKLLAQHTPHQRLPVFIQVNLDDDSHRGGVSIQNLDTLAQEIKAIPKLELQGLMAILPIDTKHEPAYWFKQMQDLRRQEYQELSMGMSQDFQEAIRYDATWIRLGTILY